MQRVISRRVRENQCQHDMKHKNMMPNFLDDYNFPKLTATAIDKIPAKGVTTTDPDNKANPVLTRIPK